MFENQGMVKTLEVFGENCAEEAHRFNLTCYLLFSSGLVDAPAFNVIPGVISLRRAVSCRSLPAYRSLTRSFADQEIRKQFNIVNDFTPEEEAQVREENRWCEDA